MKGIVRLAGASLLLVAVVLGLAACQIGPLDIVRGSGNVQTATRTVRNFSKVELRDQGTLIIEQVYALPGIGQLMYNSILQRDFPAMKAATFVSAIMVVLVYLLADILHAALDPRVRFY